MVLGCYDVMVLGCYGVRALFSYLRVLKYLVRAVSLFDIFSICNRVSSYSFFDMYCRSEQAINWFNNSIRLEKAIVIKFALSLEVLR